MNITAVQLDVVWEDPEANFERVRQLLGRTPPPPGSLILLPEMFSTGFSFNQTATHPGTPSRVESFLQSLAQSTLCAVLGGGIGLGSGRARNEAVAFGPDGTLLARYAKIHPFGLCQEGDHYGGGGEVVTFDWGGFRIAPLICYDLRFPEVFRTAVDQGATLLAVIALWPARRASHWTTLLQARAIENQAYVVGVNRVGVDPIGSYSGRSCVVHPQGIIIADAGESEGILNASLDRTAVDRWREEFPALKDRHWSGSRHSLPPS